MSGQIGVRQKDENLGTTEAAANIDAEEPPGPSDVLEEVGGGVENQRQKVRRREVVRDRGK